MNIKAKIDSDLLFREQKLQYTNLGEIQLAYRMIKPAGDDSDQHPVILFIHGWPVNSLTYEHIINHLRLDFTCIAIDLPGLGKTNWHHQVDLSPKGQATLLRDFMHKQGIKSYSIFGNDSGGMIARYLADLDKNKITGLMLSNTEVPNEHAPWISLYKQCLRIPGFSKIISRLLSIKAFVRSPMAFGDTFYDKAYLDGEFHTDFIQPLLTSDLAFKNAISSFKTIFDWQQLDNLKFIHPNLSIPTSFIWGKEDPTFPQKSAKKMASQLPSVTGFHSISQAKLFVHQEKPKEVSNYIRKFMFEHRLNDEINKYND